MKKKQMAPRGWQENANGYEITKSPQFIMNMLSSLKKNRRFIILLHKGYQSGNTAIIALDAKNIDVDCPPDWPGNYHKIKVLFRDDSNVWNYFNTQIISENQDTLKLFFPTELFRMQRRAHFRVQIPGECKAEFICQGEKNTNLRVEDLSVGGMKVCMTDAVSSGNIKDAEPVVDILIRFSGGENTDGEQKTIAVSEGFVARSLIMADNQKCLGIKFNLQGTEEKELSQFVRKSELAELRKGM